MTQPLVSVCVPVYNGGAFLERCLGSIAAQSYANLQVVLVDDGSTDDSVARLESFAAGREHVTVHRNDTNLGLPGNWNRCMELAGGEWVKFVFQDDWLTTDCVARLVEAAHDATDLVLCAREYEFDDRVPTALRDDREWLRSSSERYLGAEVRHLDVDEVAAALARWGNWNFLGEPVAVLLRRAAVDRVGPFSDRFHVMSDYVHWLRVAMHSGCTWVPDRLAGFLVHQASVSGSTWETYEVQQLESALFFATLMRDADFAPFREHLRRTGQLDRYAAAARWLAADSYRAARWSAHTGEGPGALQAWRDCVRRPGNARLLGARSVERWAPLFRLRRAWRRRTGGGERHVGVLRPVDLLGR